MDQRHPSLIRKALLALLLFACTPAAQVPLLAQQPQPQQPNAPLTQAGARLQWAARRGVRRYRLQVARDQKFKDIVFDRIVIGTDYQLTELPVGPYFWRVAPAVHETGRYSAAQPMQVVEGFAATATATPQPSPGPQPTPSNTRPTPSDIVKRPALITPRPDSGWRTATGEVAQPVAAHLRNAESFDLACVNTDGMVYALDGGTGAALWSARYRPGARRGEPTGSGGVNISFGPLPLKGAGGLTNLLVAYDGGVRALAGTNGRELWRTPLTERALTGALTTDEPQSVVILTGSEDAASLLVLDAATGKVQSNTKLEGGVIGKPVPFSIKELRGIMLALKGGGLELRSLSGERVRSLKMDAAITTTPLVIEGAYGPLLLVGTESGLISLDAAELRPIGRIATEDDAPRGTLAAADLNNDGRPEIVMLTRKGRVVAIGSDDGRIKWYTSGATDAASATFADLNGDGVLDVLVATGPAFASGFSGSDGALLWRAEEPGGTAATAGSTRTLVTAAAAGGRNSYIVGNDPAHATLRAVGLPSGSLRGAGQ